MRIYDFGEIDWDEFWSVVKGGGPCNLKIKSQKKPIMMVLG